MTLEHVGIAVADAEKACALYERLFGLRPYKTETVEREGVRTHFLDAGVKLELLEALGPDSPVAKFLDKRGEGIHHLAFHVPDVDAALVRLRSEGFTPLTDTPKPGADGKRIFFLHPRDTLGVLIECCGDDARLPEPTLVPFEDAHLAAYKFGAEGRPPLLLLHGAAGSTLLETLGLARKLEARFSVIALDLEAHGQSRATASPLTLDRLADGALATLDHFGIEQAAVAGYSLGGAVALRLAQRAPARVRRLAVHATNLFWDVALVQRMHARLDADLLARRAPDYLARLEEAHEGRTREVFARVRAFTETLPGFRDEMHTLGSLHVPTLVSAGDHDDLFALDLTLSLHRLLPSASLAILPGLRHRLRPEDAPRVAAEMERFLARG